MGDSSPLLINPQYKQVGKSPKREINDSLQHICIYTNELTAPRDASHQIISFEKKSINLFSKFYPI